MKIFISADIEGVTGVTQWEETEHGGKDYEMARRQMSLEAAAACEAILEAGHTVVTGRSIMMPQYSSGSASGRSRTDPRLDVPSGIHDGRDR